MENNRNFFLAMALSVLILFLWQAFYMGPRIEAEKQRQKAIAEREASAQTQAQADGDDGAPVARTGPSTSAPDTDDDPSVESARIAIDTPALEGSIRLRSARIDDLSLKRYHETIEPNSPDITLLKPSRTGDGYFVEFGYVGDEPPGPLPGAKTEWTIGSNAVLTPQTPVTVEYDNKKGLKFSRQISVDDNYLFTYTDTIVNKTDKAVSISSYGRVQRAREPESAGLFILHEGPVGSNSNNRVIEHDYSTLREDGNQIAQTANDGWLGITDKYWAAVIVPEQGRNYQSVYTYSPNAPTHFQVQFKSEAVEIPAGGSVSVTNRAFTGAKVVSLLKNYEEQGNIINMSWLIDWGWFHFITRPLFALIDWFYKWVGNFGVAILLTTVVVKALFFYFANKSYVSMANMKRVQPQMMEIKERCGDDRMKMQQETMELYKREKINPLAGCWPILIQIPVFFALYKVLYVTIEMRHAPFFGWIQDLAAPDPTSIFNLFGLLPWGVPGFLLIGVWPLIMGITMFLQMRMNPTPPDPAQAMVFNWMPVVFTFLLATFPAGLVIYWAWNNFLSIIQQGVIMKRQGAKIELWDNLANMFSRKPKTEA